MRVQADRKTRVVTQNYLDRVSHLGTNNRPEQSHMRQVQGTRFFCAKRGVGIFVKDSFPISAPDASWRVLGKGFSVTVKLSFHHHVPAIRRVVPINFFCAEVVSAYCGGRCSSLTFVRLRVAISAEQRDDRKTCGQHSSFHLISSSRRVSSAIAADL